MASKVKIAAMTLATVFTMVATPVVAFYAESWLEEKRMSAEGRADIAMLESQVEMTPEESRIRDARTNLFESCMDRNALPSLAIARASRNWGDRLSFWPAASSQLNNMADMAEIRGLALGFSCLRQLDRMAPPAPLV